MLFVVRFTDRPDRLAIRHTFMAAHLEWLARHESRVKAAGSLRVSSDTAPVGGLWIVEGDDAHAVEHLLQTDPFWAQGLRQSVEILQWSRGFPDRPVTI